MKIEYNKQTHEAEPAFYFERRTLFHLHARGEEVTVTFHADEVSRARLASDETIDAGFREQIKRKPWASFPLHSTRELAPFLDLVRAKYRMISEQTAEGEATREANRFEPSERESVAPVAVAARPADPA